MPGKLQAVIQRVDQPEYHRAPSGPLYARPIMVTFDVPGIGWRVSSRGASRSYWKMNGTGEARMYPVAFRKGVSYVV